MKAITIGILLPLISFVLLAHQSASTGSITGRVVPGYTGLAITLSRYTYDDNGELTLNIFKMARTSLEMGKFGEFRFDDVEPGEYYVHADPFGLSAPKGEVLPITYYPGAQELGGASPIVVKAGAEIRLGDLNLLPVPTPSIRLRLVDATGNSGFDKSCVSVSWKRRGIPGSEKLNNNLIRCGPADLTTFPLPILSPGTYDVYAAWSGKPTGTGLAGGTVPAHGAAVSFEIRNLDFEVEVVVSHARVSAKIAIEDSDGSLPLRPAEDLQMSLQSKRIGPAAALERAADGSLRRDGVGGNEYTVQFTGLPSNAYVARLTHGDRDVLKDGLEVRSVDIDLDGLISFAGGTLEGAVRNAGNQPVPRAILALVPDPSSRGNHLYRATTADEDGTFTIRGIAPGSYRLFAWSKLNGAAYKNAVFMEPYQSRGIPVVIERNGRGRIEMKLLDE